jgi:hypothetical protein
MRIRMTAIIVALFALVVVALSAQTRPDFSGTWISVDTVASPAPPLPPSTPDGPPPPPPPPRTLSLSITQSPTEMKVDRRVEVAGREEIHPFIYKLDGSETVNHMGVLVFTANASWDAERLVVSSAVSTEGNAVGTMKDIYRLENGDLIIENTRTAPVGVFTSRAVYRRQ